jgi:serine/threonine protein kinase
MARHIPVHTTNRRDCEALHKVYKKGKTSLGKGAFGEVYEACIRGTNDCGYVLKVITYDHEMFKRSGGKSIERYYRDWYNEAKVFEELNKFQEKNELVFSPILYDRWFCAKRALDKKGNSTTMIHFYLLMERYDGDLLHLFPDRDAKYRNVAIAMALERMEAYLFIIHHNLKICLNDIKLQNILYKRTMTGIQLVFADFGIATRHSDEECIRIDTENFKALKSQFM